MKAEKTDKRNHRQENDTCISTIIFLSGQLHLDELRHRLSEAQAALSQYKAIGIVDGHKYLDDVNESGKQIEILQAVIALGEKVKEHHD